MQVIVDLHVHSKYSRATSKDLTPVGLAEAAKIKGIDIIGTGDFTHPQYQKELRQQLTPAENHPGLFCLSDNLSTPQLPLFMLTTEIACIYSQGGETRRNHIFVAVPDFATVEKINSKLSLVGNLTADGRPILGLSSERLAELVLEVNPQNLVIPAHIWTPWFSTFGSHSGFDSLKECFGKMTEYILAVETGLSSDPSMNWRVKELDDYAIISNGDAHSLSKIAREATVFELSSVSYQNIVAAMKNSARINKDQLPSDYIKYTIEFYPEEGKYHWDGHRNCGLRLTPEETAKFHNICPQCHKELTKGVMNRVLSLAQRDDESALDYAQKCRPDFKRAVPLEEIIADALNQKVGTKKVEILYQSLIKKAHPRGELAILLDYSLEELEKITAPEIVLGIKRVRDGDIYINPGYDGVFGEVKIFNPDERKDLKSRQTTLF